MKKGFIILLLIFFIHPSVWGFNFGFDKTKGILEEEFLEGFADLSSSMVKVHCKGVATGVIREWDYKQQRYVHKESEGTFYQTGNGFAVKNDFVITTAHIVTPNQVSVQVGNGLKEVVPVVQVKLLSIAISGRSDEGEIPATIYSIDHEQDVVLLKISQPLALRAMKYGVGYTYWRYCAYVVDKLEIGTVVAIIARIRSMDGNETPWYEIRWGTVIAPEPSFPGEEDKWIFALGRNSFTMDIPIYPGDSGSPIIAFEKGEPVVVGIVKAVTCSRKSRVCYSYGVRLDRLARILDSK